ncbi:MAG: T9SS type A sorting domain-containing protein [Bacteroidales bacterium]|jgi:hypothetical protein|nr:T9SS type A sorting domain-containing protein [Bacteroidales bacterium]
MRKKYSIILGLLVMVSLSPGSYAQRLIIRLNDGNENSSQLNTVQKVYFSDNELVVDFISGLDDRYTLSDVRKIYFDPMVSVDEPCRDEHELVVYPNPAGDHISVQGIPGNGEKLMIFSMDGRLVISRDINADHEYIDINGLPAGLYLIHTSGSSTKFVRK